MFVLLALAASAAVLLVGPRPHLASSVVLVRQFRYPAYVNGHNDLLIEAAAGLLDNESPEVRIRAEDFRSRRGACVFQRTGRRRGTETNSTSPR